MQVLLLNKPAEAAVLGGGDAAESRKSGCKELDITSF